ncbi:glycosyltransferase [Candidatus Nitrospira salsa]
MVRNRKEHLDLGMRSPGQKHEEVTIAIVNYNGRDILGDTIRSCLDQDYEAKRIIMVDDGSNDGSVEFVKSKFPEVVIIEMGGNTKNLNRVRNVAIKNAKSSLVFLIDNDIVLGKGVLKILVAFINSENNVAICSPRLLYYTDPSKINMDVIQLHYLGTAVAYNRDAPLTECVKYSVPQMKTGCGILLLKKQKVEEIGLFDEGYLMAWGDDGELYHRLQLAGYKCWHIPQAICFHKTKEWSGARHFRAFGQVYNRWRLIITSYSTRTMVFCLPVLCVYDLLQLGFFFYKRFPSLYFKALYKLLKEVNELRIRRKQIQKTRKVSDRQLLVSGPIYVSPYLMNNKLLSLFVLITSYIFNAYWAMVKRAL